MRTRVLVKVCDVLNYDDFKDLSTSDISEKIKSIIQSNLDLERNNVNKKK